MKWMRAVVLAAALLVGSGCAATPSVLPGPQGNLPVDAELPSAAGFNPPAFSASAQLAAANLEASRLKTAAVNYLATQPGSVMITSDQLMGPGSPAKAWYRFDAATSITRVDSVPDGWIGIVFDLSQQKWVNGTPDNDHIADQDVP